MERLSYLTCRQKLKCSQLSVLRGFKHKIYTEHRYKKTDEHDEVHLGRIVGACSPKKAALGYKLHKLHKSANINVQNCSL